MENVLQQIVTDEVTKHFTTEKAYYENVLGITQQSWNRWKRGDRGFSDQNMDTIKQLYTDYEWMIVQKLVSELSNKTATKDDELSPYMLYLQVKQDIAKEWIKNGAEIDITEDQTDEKNHKNPGTKIIITAPYDLPLENHDDIITFHFSEVEGKLKTKPKKRKKWFKKNRKNIV